MENLKAALEQQLNLLKELHTLLKLETNELAGVHLDAMADINVRKEDLTSRLSAHAENLRSLMLAAVTREGLSTKATLGELAACYSKKGNREIARLHGELNETADQTKELLALNREIAERFAASVGNSLDFIARILNQNSTYGASGSYQQRPSGAVLINREA